MYVWSAVSRIVLRNMLESQRRTSFSRNFCVSAIVDLVTSLHPPSCSAESLRYWFLPLSSPRSTSYSASSALNLSLTFICLSSAPLLTRFSLLRMSA